MATILLAKLFFAFKGKCMGKKGDWIPIDKNFVYYLPKDRKFTELEAMFSYTLDRDKGKENSLRGYSKIWGWNKLTVKRFIEKINRCPPCDRLVTALCPPIYFIDKDLWVPSDHDVTGLCPPSDHTLNPNPNLKDKKKKVKKKSNGKIPPQIDDVKKYCVSKGYTVDCDRWFNYYQSKGWMIGKNKMVDWQAAIRTWESNGKTKRNNTNGFLEARKQGTDWLK